MTHLSYKTLAALALTTTFAMSAQANTSEKISKAEYGDAWPLTLDQADLVCIPPSTVVVKADGVIYALNGVASAQAKQRGWEKLDPIWRADPKTKDMKMPLKVSVSSLIERGLKLCQ